MIERDSEEDRYSDIKMKPEEIRTQYDRIGEAYVREQERFIRENGDFASDLLLGAARPPGGRVLDIGCGDGSFLLKCLFAGTGFVHGIDPSTKMLSKARTNFFIRDIQDYGSLPYHFSEGSAEKTGLGNESVDIVTSRFSLNYVEDLNHAWKEIYRVLKPKGILAFVAPHPVATAERAGRPYGSHGTFSYELFGSVPVTNYLHNFQDFFSPAFLDRFSVKDFTEFFDVKPRVEGTEGPSAFGVVARKK